MMKFSFEVPVSHLDDFVDLQDFHFALSFLCKHTSYVDFFKRMAEEGKEVWLDNSWNETGKADDPAELLEWAKIIGASKVIAPDDIDWDKRQLAEAFLEMASQLDPERIVVVVKSEEEEFWLRKLGALHFAIPFRYRLTQPYRNLSWCSPHHFLGMNHVAELQTLKPRSIDTSMPIKIALLGLSLDDWIAKGCPRVWHKDMPDYHLSTLSDDVISLARHNIIKLKEMCNEQTPQTMERVQ